MVRRFIYILLSLAVAVSAVSCLEEMEVAQPKPEGSDETILVPRVKSFTNQYITKAAYAENETKITSLALLVFNREGALVHLTETSNASGVSSITLNKSLLNSPEQRAKLASATVVMIANVSLDNIKKSDGTTLRSNKTTLTLEEMEQFSINFEDTKTVVTSLGDGFTGFPMIGGKKGVNLNPTADQQPAIEVGLKILYAKINFSISVAEGTENNPYEGVTPSFTLNNYSVFNASMATTLAIPEEEGKPVRDFLGNVADESVPGTSDEATASSSYTYTTSGAAGTASGTTTLTGNNPVNFTFYVSESRYNHNSDLKGIYPDNNWLASAEAEDVKDYNPDTDADKLNGVKYFYDDLIQQYKPKLATQSPDGAPAAGMATYVILDGSYTDYRGTVWDVKYKVYLGKDNAHNFHVDRNSEYTNLITIKGIRNNDSYGDNTQSVWVDHRVDVSLGADQGADDCVTITRETLIDSHIEVRPLRVNLPENISVALLYLPKYDGVQIEEIKGGANENWIAIENNNGRVKDITQFSSNGKRKYFTTALIEQLHLENNDETYGVRVNQFENDPRKGQRYIQLQMDKETGEGDCAWIYIDENNSENDRTATLELVFYNNNREAVMEEEFIIKQKGLHKIENLDLYIETYEEYLHTYDSQDLYTDPTKDYTQRGYYWGLLNTRISMNQYVRLSTLGSTNTDYPYDYFHSEDAEANASYRVLDVSEKDIDLSKNTGLHFTNNAGISQEMTIIDMNTRPESAIQYCLSKNKFRVDESDQEKHTMDIHWYLPDAYEMAQILTDGKEVFSDFKDNAYWSSQPSWRQPSGLDEALATGYILEDVDNARIVSLSPDGSVSHGSQTPRNELHRIRCAYSVDGIDGVDFSGTRAPEGIGAMRFYMRAWKNWDTKEPGYFSWLPKADSKTETISLQTFDYPKDANDSDQDFGKYVDGYGFELNPRDENNWDTETVYTRTGNYTSQITLQKWPGLTKSQVVTKEGNAFISGDIIEYHVLEGIKEGNEGDITTHFTKYTGDITTSELKHLDHLYESSDLSIEFSYGNNADNRPKYSYDKIDKVVPATITYEWELPNYTEITNPNEFQDYTLERSKYTYWTSTAAQNAGDDAKSKYSEYSNVTVKTERGGLSELRRYRYVITYRDYKKYYLYNSGGKWKETGKDDKERTDYTEPIDQLLMFGGNSFTIKANNENVISSVKIYFSDSNVVNEDDNLFGDSVHKYLRFTKDGFTGTEDPPGMSYSGDGDKGTMTWSGDPTSEITFVLKSYLKSYSSLADVWWGSPSSIEYKDSDSESFAKSIVIDQIDVRYKKAETTNQ